MAGQENSITMETAALHMDSYSITCVCGYRDKHSSHNKEHHANKSFSMGSLVLVYI